ncbi:MAG: HEAT repeat domain-containing protein, partial [Planctomycetota bacterium]
TVRGLLRREYPKSYLEALGAAARRVSGAEATYAEAIGFRTRNKLPLDRADVQRFLTVSEAHASDSRGEIRNQPTQAQSAWEVEGQDRGLKLDAVWLISGLREYAPDAQWDWILDQAGSASPSIRAACMRSLGTFLDVEAVPTILKGLGDSDNHVQTEARAALDKIRFYHDEKQRWQRFFEGQGLDAQNAAEALVRQAQAGQPKAQRLLAIRSLGKLADPQALPFWIEWNKESDGEITGACQKAIESILKSE